MTATPLYNELANFTYFFFQLTSLEILVSLVFTVDHHNNIRLRFARGQNHFKKTFLFVGVVILMAIGYYYVDKQFSESSIELLASFDYKLLALSVASVSFFAFYLTKVGLGRRWKFPVTYTTLSIFFISIGIFSYLHFL